MPNKEILFDPNVMIGDQRLQKLKELYPECFDKNGAFLSEKLAQELKLQSVEISKEYYNLNWLGKSYAKLLSHCYPTTLLAEDIAHNQQAQNQNSLNLLIKGDNLEVLKHLTNAYGGGYS